jgi:hypothetical protein
MKAIIGFGLVILGVVSLFRYPYSGTTGLPELMGVLIGFGIIILPGILLIKSANRNKNN